MLEKVRYLSSIAAEKRPSRSHIAARQLMSATCRRTTLGITKTINSEEVGVTWGRERMDTRDSLEEVEEGVGETSNPRGATTKQCN